VGERVKSEGVVGALTEKGFFVLISETEVLLETE
jgi:hypothetical protein